MKALSRSYWYWCNVDSDIKHFTRNCAVSTTNKNEPLKINSRPWEWPNKSWQKIPINYVDPKPTQNVPSCDSCQFNTDRSLSSAWYNIHYHHPL